MTFTTANLCDTHSKTQHLQIAEPLFISYGAKTVYSGQVTTIKTFEDNVLISTVLQEPGHQRILVIDGGGSRRCALVDASIVQTANANGWEGIIINGCIRDAALIAKLPIGIRALQTHPLKTHKQDHSDRDQLISFAGVNFKKDSFLYADMDGIIVSDTILS
jgi:regulator of ribonuclease activity A